MNLLEKQAKLALLLTFLSAYPLFAQDLIIEYRPEVRDLHGNPVEMIATNEDFWLYLFVEDLRLDPWGVFSAFVDVTYEPPLATAVGPIDHLDTYTVGAAGDISSPGVIDDAGGIDGLNPLQRVAVTCSQRGGLNPCQNGCSAATKKTKPL